MREGLALPPTAQKQILQRSMPETLLGCETLAQATAAARKVLTELPKGCVQRSFVSLDRDESPQGEADGAWLLVYSELIEL